MGRIILTIPGPWAEKPALSTPLDWRFCPADAELTEEILEVGRPAEAFDRDEARALRAHASVLSAQATFEGVGKREWARYAARFAFDAVKAGATALYVETGGKVFAPGALQRLDVRDPQVLFHIFVEVSGDAECIATEGMQAFDLPEVVVRYGRRDRGPAQVACFGLAAEMVCDARRLSVGEEYQASLSAPRYTCGASEAGEADPEVPCGSPRGHITLTLSPGQ